VSPPWIVACGKFRNYRRRVRLTPSGSGPKLRFQRTRTTMKLASRLPALAVEALPLAAAAAENYLRHLKLARTRASSRPTGDSFSSSPIGARLGSPRTHLSLQSSATSTRVTSRSRAVQRLARPSEILRQPREASHPAFSSTGIRDGHPSRRAIWRPLVSTAEWGTLACAGAIRSPPTRTSAHCGPKHVARHARAYGLGALRYEFTKAFGIHAGLERYRRSGALAAAEERSRWWACTGGSRSRTTGFARKA